MKCSAVRTFLNQADSYYYLSSSGHEDIKPIDLIPDADMAYLVSNGYVVMMSKKDHDAQEAAISRMNDISAQLMAQRAEEQQAVLELRKDQDVEHSISFHMESKEEQDAMAAHIQTEAATVTKEQSETASLEASVNELIQKKYTLDRLAPYGNGYVALTDLGVLVLSDLNVRIYRVADDEFSDFVTEVKATYGELRGIADKATTYVTNLKPRLPKIEEEAHDDEAGVVLSQGGVKAPSLLWASAIGLAKLQGDPDEIQNRFMQAMALLHDYDSTTPTKLMSAEMMTAIGKQDVGTLGADLKMLDKQVRDSNVNKELASGVASTIMAGRRFDGSYPTDRFIQFRKVSPSFEAAAILAVMNITSDDLTLKFQAFRAMFSSWGYMQSDDTEIASAFLAIGELKADEVEDKLKYVIEQLGTYLQYPLVASAILSSIAVFEAHEALDLMEKAVTMLNGYTSGLERSELVALAVRMIHGVRNEVVKQIDPTAKITETPIQFTYGARPGYFPWFGPVIIAHSSYHATFSGMGGFHPAHSHGVGGFAG